jgi:HAD superfamily hydrolase (TIGR01509 family)
MLTAIILDVEGTLIDCVPHVLACWQTVLAAAGHPFEHNELQRYSGMDGADMLDKLLPHLSQKEKKRILKVQAETYRQSYLQLGDPFPKVRELLAGLKKRSLTIGIATSCKADELRIYDKRMQVLEFVDAIACGDDVRKGKPHPDLYYAVLKKLGLTELRRAMGVGDSPYDAIAAKSLGLRAAGVLTGGFSSVTLVKAGCERILRDVRELDHLNCLRGGK